MRRALLLTILFAACARHETPAVPPTPKRVFLISIDTLRADHLPAYGYGNGRTPNIEALRTDGVLFANAYSHVPLTLPSHVSILTGELPPDNGVRNNIGFPFDASKHPTIPSLLKQQGYVTGAAISAYVLRGNTGLANAFDFYEDNIEVKTGEAIGRLRRPGMESETIAEGWISQRRSSPLFFFLHIFEPHTPYDPTYDASITKADAVVGKFVAFLKRQNLYDDSLIVLLSDHGEGLGQHGEDEHGIFLYREDLHVPLIVKLPKAARANTRIDAPAQLIDVLPTIVPGAKTTKGRSLFASGPVRRIYSETLYPRIHLGWSELRSLIDDRFHFIDAPRPELYALADVGERNNIVGDNRRESASMRKDLDPYNREMPAIGAIDPEEAKRLAALGYVGSAAAQTGGPLPDPKDHIAELAMMKEATGFEMHGRPDQAIAMYREIIARNPRFTDAWSQLARVLQQSGHPQESIDTYKHAIEVAPSLAPEFSLALGDLYLSQNEPDEAAAHAQLGLQTNPGSAHVILGHAALANGDLAGAAAEAQKAMQSFSYRAPALVLTAEVLVKQRRLDEASAALDQALADIHARNGEMPPLLYYVRGDILARQNRIEEAIAAFNEEIRLYPHDRQAYANLAVVYALSDNRGKANETMERLVRANGDPAAYALVVSTFEQIGDGADAAVWRNRGHASR